MIETSLLSKDEHLTPNIDGVSCGTLDFQKEGSKYKNRRKLDFSILVHTFFSARIRRNSLKFLQGIVSKRSQPLLVKNRPLVAEKINCPT